MTVMYIHYYNYYGVFVSLCLICRLQWLLGMFSGDNFGVYLSLLQIQRLERLAHDSTIDFTISSLAVTWMEHSTKSSYLPESPIVSVLCVWSRCGTRWLRTWSAERIQQYLRGCSALYQLLLARRFTSRLDPRFHQQEFDTYAFRGPH